MTTAAVTSSSDHLSPASLFFFVVFFVTTIVVSTHSSGPPHVLSSYQRSHRVRAGNTLTLTCPVESEPQSFVEWQKDRQTVSIGWSRFSTQRRNNALRIRDLHIDDTGAYRCRATNGFGTVEVSFEIFVFDEESEVSDAAFTDFDKDLKSSGSEGLPSFQLPEQMKEDHIVQLVGETARLRCFATGKPSPDIFWYKNGIILPEQPNHSGTSDGGSSQWQLWLPNLSIAESGKYTCKVFNRLGAINFTYTVQVIDSRPIIENIQNSTVSVGETLVLQCLIYSKERPIVKWLKRLDGLIDRHETMLRTISIQNERYTVIDSGGGGQTVSTKRYTHLNKLTVTGVSAEDTGLYVCSCVSPHHGSAQFSSTFVDVLPDAFAEESTKSIDETPTPPMIIALGAAGAGAGAWAGAWAAGAGALCLLVVVVAVVGRRSRCRDRCRRWQQSSPQSSCPPTISSSSVTGQPVDRQHDHQYQTIIVTGSVRSPLKNHQENVSHPSSSCHLNPGQSDEQPFASDAPPMKLSSEQLHGHHLHNKILLFPRHHPHHHLLSTNGHQLHYPLLL